MNKILEIIKPIVYKLYSYYEGGLPKSPYRLGGTTGNVPSPRVPIKREDIECDIEFDIEGDDSPRIDMVSIYSLSGVTINTVQNTNSMEPVPDIGHTIILSDDSKYMESIKVGSVIIFDAGNGQRIIHQIISKHEYEGETYYITQGWNLNNPDPYQIYKEQIESVLLGVIFTEKYSSYVAGVGD